MKTPFIFVLALIAGFVVSSCGGGQAVTVPYEISGITFQLDTPILSGAYSMQAEIPVDLTEAFKKVGADKNKIKSAAIESFQFTMANNSNFDNFQSFVVQIMSDNMGMSALGGVSAINKGSTQLTLEPAVNENLSEYFRGDKIYFIIDTYIAQVDTAPYTITGSLSLKFSSLKK